MLVGNQEISILEYDKIIQAGNQSMERGDDENKIKVVLITSLRKYNYVPKSVEKEYIEAIWKEFLDNTQSCMRK